MLADQCSQNYDFLIIWAFATSLLSNFLSIKEKECCLTCPIFKYCIPSGFLALVLRMETIAKNREHWVQVWSLMLIFSFLPLTWNWGGQNFFPFPSILTLRSLPVKVFIFSGLRVTVLNLGRIFNLTSPNLLRCIRDQGKEGNKWRDSVELLC